MRLLDERLEVDIPTPCYILPQLDLYIEYTYVIDLDREVFSVNNGAHFVLGKIPRDSWMKSLAFDNGSAALIIPDLVPEGSIADLPSLRFKHSKPNTTEMVVQDFDVISVQPKAFLNFPMVLRHGPLLLAHLWRAQKASLEYTMPWVLRGLTPEDFAFREIAFAILSLSAGLTSGLMLACGQRQLEPSPNSDWRCFILGDNPRGRPVVLSDVGIGYHAEGIDPGSSPQASTYWFHGALIRLEADLTNPDRVKEAIAQAISFGQSTNTTADVFDVVLLSIEHVVLLHIAGSNVQRTDTLLLLDIEVHYTDCLNRYAVYFRYPGWGWRDYKYKKYHEDDKQQENDAGDDGLSVVTSDAETEEVDDPDTTDEAKDTTEEVKDTADEAKDTTDEARDTTDEVNDQWPQCYRGFFAMVHLFEAVAKRAIPPDRPKEGVFPTEIYEMIISHVDDTTYRACSTVSRKFRHYCQRNLRIVEGTRIYGLAPPVAKTAQPSGSHGRADDPEHFKQYAADSNETLSVDWDAVRFILEDEDGECYGAYPVKALHHGRRVPSNYREWLVICGESERLSYINSFTFTGYYPPDLWEEEEQPKATPGTPGGWDRPGPFALPLELGDNSHFWSSRFVVSELSSMQEITMRTLPELWNKILRLYIKDAPSFLPFDKFKYPAHTKVTILDAFMSGSDVCVGYIRFKRPDAIVGPSQVWELAVSEAEEDVCYRGCIRGQC